jgi:hypothetical protein
MKFPPQPVVIAQEMLNPFPVEERMVSTPSPRQEKWGMREFY